MYYDLFKYNIFPKYYELSNSDSKKKLQFSLLFHKSLYHNDRIK